MKALSPKATAIILEVLAGINDVGDHKKLDSNPVFMPLVVECIGATESGTMYSLAHYGELNNDLMKDPEMTFLMQDGVEGKKFYAASFANDYAGHYRESINLARGLIVGVVEKEQESQTNFAELWLDNIKAQQLTTEQTKEVNTLFNYCMLM